jgi:hypothetical protein
MLLQSCYDLFDKRFSQGMDELNMEAEKYKIPRITIVGFPRKHPVTEVVQG